MHKKVLIVAIIVASIGLGIGGAIFGVLWQYFVLSPPPSPAMTEGAVVQLASFAGRQDELEKRYQGAPGGRMSRSGLAGAMGGVHVQAFADAQEILVAMPQLANGQVPLCYFIRSTPPEAVTEFRLRTREDTNVVVSARLSGSKPAEAQITWSAVVLLTDLDVTPNTTPAEPYRAATGCVQSSAVQIANLAEETWPASGQANEFAANIQRHIRGMKRQEQPRSLDAVGILSSGEPGICTANANLAAALMRSKGIACRSLAVVPPISQRLEMHRIVEYYDDGMWLPFDPSSLQAEIPCRPWHNIVMSRSTIWDEQAAMRPRSGAMVGCPYGQEVEMLTTRVGLRAVQDFFWTEAKPLAEFEVTEETAKIAAAAWKKYLETGLLSPSQLAAAAARNATEFEDALTAK